MIRFRLTLMSFLQFFVWGCWLITIGAYWFTTKKWDSQDFGVIFSTMGIAALFMPAISGIIADRFLSAQKLYGLYHILAGIGLYYVPSATSPAVPVALSSAPLQILSPFTGSQMPKWSQCAE